MSADIDESRCRGNTSPKIVERKFSHVFTSELKSWRGAASKFAYQPTFPTKLPLPRLHTPLVFALSPQELQLNVRKKAMTGGQFLRKGGKGCLRRLLERRSILDFCVSTEASVISKQQSRAYGRSPILSRKFRESGISPPIYSSSLSSSCASSSRNGLVGWYLGLIESRPVLTKSITSALIYTAADLTSQVNPRFLFYYIFPVFLC